MLGGTRLRVISATYAAGHRRGAGSAYCKAETISYFYCNLLECFWEKVTIRIDQTIVHERQIMKDKNS